VPSLQLYIRRRISELAGIGVKRGLDKFFTDQKRLRSLGFARDGFDKLTIAARGSDAAQTPQLDKKFPPSVPLGAESRG